jgi:AAA15 family ATPase/GTPase
MALIENLTIKNFRGFDSLNIDGLSKINLFVGKNNSGKTSILESILLLAGSTSIPILPHNINLFRGLNPVLSGNLHYLFNKLKFDNTPFFHAKFSNKSEREVTVEIRHKQNEFTGVAASSITTSASNTEIAGLDLKLSITNEQGHKESYKSSTTINDNQITFNTPDNYVDDLYVEFVYPKVSDADVVMRIADIIKRKAGAAILELLQTFDKNIKNFHLIVDNIYFDVDGMDELVPMNIMGEGIRRFLHIITSAAIRQNAIVLIDEIENDLHYSEHKLLWQSLINFTENNNIQLFIATHNLETLSYLTTVLEKKEYSHMQDFVKIFTVAKTIKNGWQTYKCSYKGFKNAIEHEVEMR